MSIKKFNIWYINRKKWFQTLKSDIWKLKICKIYVKAANTTIFVKHFYVKIQLSSYDLSDLDRHHLLEIEGMRGKQKHENTRIITGDFGTDTEI